MRLSLALLMFARAAWADTCPPVPPFPASHAQVMEDIRLAGDAETARLLSHQVWLTWSTAPDSYAQELLDTGMERRGAFDFEGANKAFDALIAYCPDYGEGYNQRAFVAFLREDFTAALADLDIALRLVPDHFAAHAGRALTLMNLGQVDAGQSALKQALTLNPWLPERHMLIPEPGTKL